MGELVMGKISLFLNAENLLNLRQTHYDPLLLPRRAAPRCERCMDSGRLGTAGCSHYQRRCALRFGAD
ncbi:hypothetical protein ABVV53_11060 [Novosphingobium sp. RD2P27]|uniref:Uncharacterized protein n=1 Tax=Novosphingobium kalidii TaxID=3230299 RepID=A0ABV2D2B5_9SPHN